MSGNDRLREKLAVAAAPGTEKAQAQPGAVTIFDQVRSLRPQIVAAVNSTPVDPDRFLRVALTELRRNPRLMAAEPATILGGLMLAAQLGLEIGGALGHCYLVPFRNTRSRSVEAVFILGYRGMITLARRSGEIESIVARVVHQRDQFDVEYGLDELLRHIPNLSDNKGPPVAVYAIAKYVGGGHAFLVLTADQVNSYRSRSRARDEGPWVTDWEAMAAKTAVRRLSSFLPLTVEAARAAAIDEAVITTGGTQIDLDELAANASDPSQQQKEVTAMVDTPPEPDQPEEPAPDPGQTTIEETEPTEPPIDVPLDDDQEDDEEQS